MKAVADREPAVAKRKNIFKEIIDFIKDFNSPSSLKKKKVIFKGTKILWKILRAFILFGLSFIILYPLLYIISVGFRFWRDVYDPSVIWIPKNWTIDNIFQAAKGMDYGKSVSLSASISLVSSILTIISCSMAGYGFARFKFKFRGLLFTLLIFTVLVPPQLTIIPMYVQYRYFDIFGIGQIAKLFTGELLSINLLNTLWAFFIPAVLAMGIRSGLFIYMFRQFFRSLPKELEDAAAIDGCGFLQTFVRIMVPNSLTMMITVLLFSIVWYWNDYYYSAIFFNNLSTVPKALTQLGAVLYSQTNVGDPYMFITRIQAGSLLTIAPILAMYIFLQRFFVQGIERSGIVG